MKEYSILWKPKREPCPRVDLFVDQLTDLLRRHGINLAYDEDLKQLVAIPFEEGQVELLENIAVSEAVLNYQG